MKRIFALLLALFLLTGCTPAPASNTTPFTAGDALTVHFIDVGQADCALLECGGMYALIDGGNAADGKIVVDYLQKQGVERLNLMVATHPHEDHIGGLPAVLDAFDVVNVWSSEIPFSNSIVSAFTIGTKSHGITMQYPKVGDTFYLGGATITMLGPVKRGYEDDNNLSLVLLVQYGDTRFLFTGDMESDAEKDLIDSGADVKADVLKVGHHGSYSSTSYVFLREVAPTYAVISVGRNNDYGHPHDAPVSRLQDADVTIYRTDRMYTVVAASDGKNISFTWGNPQARPWYPNAA